MEEENELLELEEEEAVKEIEEEEEIVDLTGTEKIDVEEEMVDLNVAEEIEDEDQMVNLSGTEEIEEEDQMVDLSEAKDINENLKENENDLAISMGDDLIKEIVDEIASIESNQKQSIFIRKTAMDQLTKKEDEKDEKIFCEQFMEVKAKIDAQNNIINELKKKICLKYRKAPRTKGEEREINCLNYCLEKEHEKLACIIKEAISMQKNDPSQHWGEIPIATTFEEDGMPLSLCYKTEKHSCESNVNAENGPKYNSAKSRKFYEYSPVISDDESNKLIECLLKHCCSKNDDDCIDVEKLLKQRKSSTKSGGRDVPHLCKELSRSYSVQDKIVADNANLEYEKYTLQEELLARDSVIESLNQKLQLLQNDLMKAYRQSNRTKDSMVAENTSCLCKSNGKFCDFENKALINLVRNMELKLKHLKLEVNCLKNERHMWINNLENPLSNKGVKDENLILEEFTNNNTKLINECGKNITELVDAQETLQNIAPITNQPNKSQQIELEILRLKLQDFQEEQDEFKYVIKDQSKQLEEYRCKYLTAQQKVDYQRCLIGKMEMNNKKIEEQINLEIEKIKSKFQAKLKEFTHLPKLLEDEQIKLHAAEKEKEDLQNKLHIICKEFEALKKS